MDTEGLISKIQGLGDEARRGRWEQVLATLTILLASGGLFFTVEGKELPKAASIALAAFALCAVSAICLAVRVWKRAGSTSTLAAEPLPDPVKGLLPFNVSDGALFAGLGRHIELSRLLGLARNDQIGISVVRGESGAGKTSLLQAGLQYSLGEKNCIYWEAVPTQPQAALLYAIQSQGAGLGELTDLDSLPGACAQRCILILDQFEQLHPSRSEQATIFSLLDRIGKAPPPHKLSVVVGFRREYTPDWLDFEQSHGWRAEQVAVNLLAEPTAREVLFTLCSQAGFQADQALATKFVSTVTGEKGVSPVDIAIGVLGLANWTQQHGASYVGLRDFELSGGAEGLLMSFVQEELQEIHEVLRAPLLKGIVFALIDLSNDQRVAAGANSAIIAALAEKPESSLLPWLERLAHPRIRLLECCAPQCYRLTQDRLVPVLRRLAGQELASDDQVRLRFETDYISWCRSKSNRHLLGGKDLRLVSHHPEQFIYGENVPSKTEYLAASLTRRKMLRAAIGGAGLATAASTYGIFRGADSMMQRHALEDWRLPSDLFSVQHDLDSLEISQPINDFTWLRSLRLRDFKAEDFGGASLRPLEALRLDSLELTLPNSLTHSLVGLDRLKNLNSLGLNLDRSPVCSLAGLEQLQKLSSLSLTVGSAPIDSLPALDKLDRLTSLTLDLRASSVGSLPHLEKVADLHSLTLGLGKIDSISGLERLNRLTSLTLLDGWITAVPGLERRNKLTFLSLKPQGSTVADLGNLEKFKSLTSLKLDLSNSPAISSLAGLEKLSSMSKLTLDLANNSQIRDLAPLRGLSALTSLELNLAFSKIGSLADLEQLPNLTSLTLSGYRIDNPADLEKLKRLNALSLDLGTVDSLMNFANMKGLTSLTLMNGFMIKSLSGLGPLPDLKSLELRLRSAPVQDLSPLDELTSLNSLSLDLRSTPVTNLPELKQLKYLASLTLNLADLFGSSSIASLTCLERMGSLKSAELWLPVNLVSRCAKMNMPMPNTKIGCRL